MVPIKSDRIAMVFCPRWCNVPPIALAYIKGAVRNRQIDCFDYNLEFFTDFVPNHCEVFEANFPAVQPFMGSKPDFAEFAAACGRFAAEHAHRLDRWCAELSSYGIVGLSVTQENIVASVALAHRLKAQGALVLAGGPSINMDGLVFTHYLLESGLLDVAVLGIAEDVIETLLDRLVAGDRIDDLPGLIYRDSDGAIARTTPKAPSLDKIRVAPDYDDFDLGSYIASRNHWLSIYAVVGCKASCEFCTIHEFYPGYNFKSNDAIKEEMLTLRAKYRRNHFFFSDSMFLGNKARAEDLFDFAIVNDLKLALQVRVMKYWNDETLVAKAAKCVVFLQVGLESASPPVRRAMGKMVNHDVTMSVYRLFYKYRLPLYTNIIVGYPNETEDDFQITYDFLEDYFQQPGILGIGMNSFFVPNDFNTEKYGITRDARGRWRSPAVDVYDRVSRITRICQLAEKHGINWGSIFYADAVDGIPLMLNVDPAPPDRTDLVFAQGFAGPAGFVEEAVHYKGQFYLWGWARDPSRARPPSHVCAIAEGRVVATARVAAMRPDVAMTLGEEHMAASGWSLWLDPANLGGSSRVGLYGLNAGRLYEISSSIDVSALIRQVA